MQIMWEEYNKTKVLNLKDGINLVFSSGNTNKRIIFNNLNNYFNGKNKDFIVNGKRIDKDDFNVIYYDEESDFNNEFSFTKNNALRSLIYNSIIESINTDKILKDVNNIFNNVDNKINSMINRNINKKYNDKLKLDINITSIESIISKYTDIYINDYLISNKNLSKEQKRKIIYQTLLYQIKNSNKTNIVIIDNFDIYLDSLDAIKLIDKFKKINNTIFILSTINNIYEFTDENINIYKYANNTFISFNNIKSIIRDYFENMNIKLLIDSDVNSFYLKYYNNIKNKIGVILTSNEVTLTKKYPKNINKKYIIYNDNEELKFLMYISKKLLTPITNYDKLKMH